MKRRLSNLTFSYGYLVITSISYLPNLMDFFMSSVISCRINLISCLSFILWFSTLRNSLAGIKITVSLHCIKVEVESMTQFKSGRLFLLKNLFSLSLCLPHYTFLFSQPSQSSIFVLIFLFDVRSILHDHVCIESWVMIKLRPAQISIIKIFL
ncbi:hypothetical protein V8G54_019289 [Vigna mungo]|uniref:Uncharacterized protein n=1 Tax=Vigna mungo TaxID=3915 RepID=A0AAQ3RUT6_VIGMU